MAITSKNVREFIESPMMQGIHEVAVYRINAIQWKTPNPTHAFVNLYEPTTRTLLNSTMLSGDPAISGSLVFTPAIYNIEEGKHYLLLIGWSGTFGIRSAYGTIIGEL